MIVPRDRRCFTADASALKTSARWIVGPAAHPITLRENRSITTAGERHPCQARTYVASVAHAALAVVGAHWRSSRMGACTAGVPTAQRCVRYPCSARSPCSRSRQATRWSLHVSPTSRRSRNTRGAPEMPGRALTHARITRSSRASSSARAGTRHVSDRSYPLGATPSSRQRNPVGNCFRCAVINSYLRRTRSGLGFAGTGAFSRRGA